MISLYDNNGRITGVLDGDAQSIELNKKLIEKWVDGSFDGKTHYVENGQPIQRPNNPAILDGLTISNLPNPCKIQINSSVYNCDDPEVELDFPLPGKYKIKVMSFPYLDAEFEIET